MRLPFLLSLLALAFGGLRPPFRAKGDARETRFLGMFSFSETGHLRIDVTNFSSSTGSTEGITIYIERIQNLNALQERLGQPCPCRSYDDPSECKSDRDSLFPVLGSCVLEPDDPSRFCDRRRALTDKRRNKTRYTDDDWIGAETGGLANEAGTVDQSIYGDDTDYGDDEFGDEDMEDPYGGQDPDLQGEGAMRARPGTISSARSTASISSSSSAAARRAVARRATTKSEFRADAVSAQPCSLHPGATVDVYFDSKKWSIEKLQDSTHDQDDDVDTPVAKRPKPPPPAAKAKPAPPPAPKAAAKKPAAGSGSGKKEPAKKDKDAAGKKDKDDDEDEDPKTKKKQRTRPGTADEAFEVEVKAKDGEVTASGSFINEHARRQLLSSSSDEKADVEEVVGMESRQGRPPKYLGAAALIELASRYRETGPNPGFWAVFLYNCPAAVCAQQFSSEVLEKPAALSYTIRVSSWNSARPSPSPRKMQLLVRNTTSDVAVYVDAFRYVRSKDDPAARRYNGYGQWPAVPVMLFVAFVVYVCLSSLWVYQLIRNRDAVRPVHLFLLLAVTLKALTVLIHGLREVAVGLTGTAPHLSQLWYLLHFVRMTVFFIVIVLLGTGWNTVKEYVTQNERRVITAVLVLQVLVNLVFAIYDYKYKDTRLAMHWKWTLQVLEIVGCVAVLLPIFWAGRSLETAAAADGKAAQSLRHLNLFRFFYLVLLVWLYMTRIVVPLVQPNLPYDSTWVAPFLSELSTLLFVVAVGYAFRPVVAHGAYLSLGSHIQTPAGTAGCLAWLRRGGRANYDLMSAGAVGVGLARGAMEDDEEGNFIAQSLQELETVEERTAQELADSAIERAREARAGKLSGAVVAAAAVPRDHRE